MTGEQIKLLVSGKTVSGRHLRKDFPLKTYFAQDGFVVGLAKGNERKGKWWVNKKNMQCIKWSHRDRKFCLIVRDNGDGTYTKIRHKKRKNKKVPVVLWIKFEQGNTLSN